MKREYQSGYRKLYADKAFKQRLVQNLEDYRVHPNPARPRWMAPVAVAACLILLFGLGLPTMQRVLNQEGTTSGLSAPGDEGVTITDGVYRDSQVTNLLVLGTDSENGYDDNVMLVSLDRRREVLKCSSFRGDLNVELPEGGTRSLNRLSRKNLSPGEAVTAVEAAAGVGVDGYLQIDMADLPTVIDAMGGVTLELSSEEAMYFALSSMMEIGLPGLDAGTYELSGAQALYYLRIRQGDDHDQMLRREKLFQAFAEQVKDQDLAALANTVLSVAKTNFSVSQTTDLLLGLPVFLNSPIQMLRVPDSQEKEDVSLKDCGKKLAEFIYEELPDNSGAYVAPATPSENGTRAGNTPGNLANGGIVAAEDGRLYFIDHRGNNSICLYDPEDGTQTVLTQNPCSSLNALDGHLYFISQTDGGIYRMDSLGENRIPVSVGMEPHENLVVTPEYLYYSRGNTVYRMETGMVETSLMMNVVPEEAILEWSIGSLLDLQWNNGALYVFAKEERLPWQINVYQLNADKSIALVCAFNRPMDDSCFFHWDGDALYFTNEDGLNRWENGKTARIVSARITSMLAVNGAVYWQEESGALYRAEWNGKALTNKETLFQASEAIFRLCEADGSLYYTNAYKTITWRMDLNDPEHPREPMGVSFMSNAYDGTDINSVSSEKVEIKERNADSVQGYTTIDGQVFPDPSSR
ncbi:LCP family protein [Clostridium sp. D33t1_170424_F3]|uniref:LCP family glycopolymer transferase n=1 Tax=Clostridium sp. D33t1_170424_F3 TaxID=2787099 RepID=UPI0018AC1338|nr:LCP family protein [Clostridium sp. D33t1_170424_F3]